MADVVRRLGQGFAAAVLAAALLVNVDAQAQFFGESVTTRGATEGNVFAAAGEIDADAEVSGDIVAFGGEISIRNAIAGDVLAGGGEVIVEGTVEGDVRVVGGEILVSAGIGGDIMAAGFNVHFVEDATVGGAAWFAGSKVEIDGTVAGGLHAGGRNISITGTIAGDVQLAGEHIVVGPTARIGGDLTYRSLGEADIHPDARIGGDVTYIRSEAAHNMMDGAFSGAAGFGLVFWAGLILLGAVMILAFPASGGAALGAARTAPWRTLGLGLAVLIATPVALLILAITVVGLPIMIVGAALYFAALFVGYLLAAIGVGQWAARRLHRDADGAFWPRVGALAAGLVILTVVGLIPVLGGLFTLAALLIGLGTVARAAFALRTAPAAT